MFLEHADNNSALLRGQLLCSIYYNGIIIDCQGYFVIIKLLFYYNEALMVRRKLQAIGTSYGIIIPKLYLEEMGINPVLHDVDIEVKDKVLTVKKIDKKTDGN